MPMRRTIQRAELYERVWKVPISKLCQEYGLSDNGLRKVCRRLDVPVPKRGYWAKRAVTREQALPASSVEPKTEPPAPAPSKRAQGPPSTRTKSGKLSNPDRVIDPSTGLTKLDLARYYGLVAPLLVTHLKARPVSFVRAPSGIQGQLFFQEHLDARFRALPPCQWGFILAIPPCSKFLRQPQSCRPRR